MTRLVHQEWREDPQIQLNGLTGSSSVILNCLSMCAAFIYTVGKDNHNNKFIYFLQFCTTRLGISNKILYTSCVYWTISLHKLSGPNLNLIFPFFFLPFFFFQRAGGKIKLSNVTLVLLILDVNFLFVAFGSSWNIKINNRDRVATIESMLIACWWAVCVEKQIRSTEDMEENGGSCSGKERSLPVKDRESRFF